MNVGVKLIENDNYSKPENAMFEVTIGKSKLIPVL
jgi:hypothetical protein